MSEFLISLLICSATMSVLALLYMAIAPTLAKRYSTKWLYYAWLFIVIGLLIPFRPSFDNAPVQIEVPVPAVVTINATNPPETLPEFEPPVFTPGSSESAPNQNITVNTEQTRNTSSLSLTNLPWSTILLVTWLTGAVTILMFHVIRHKRFIRSVWRWGEEVTDSGTLEIWQRVKKEMKISGQIGLQISEFIGSPLLTGLLYPRIMLPKASIPADEMALVLKHELVHYKRKDIWYKGLVLFAIALHWFNPVVYFIAKTISLQCEKSCDDEVIKYKDADSRLQYSETIIHSIQHAKQATALSTTFYGGKKEMKSRISSIMDMGRKKRGTIILCAALLLTLGTGLVFAVNSSTMPEDSTQPDLPPAVGYEDDLTHVSSPPPGNPGIAFAFQKEMPLSMEPLPVLNEKTVKSYIYPEHTNISGIIQGYYRINNDELSVNIYSFIELNGVRYDLGQVIYGEDNRLSSSYANYFHYISKEGIKLDSSDELIYQQYKGYGAKYDAVAYYIIVDDVPIFLTEISGVVEYIDLDSSGVSSILSTDRSLPYTECYVNKLDLRNKVLHFTNLTELLKCDGVYYNTDTGLYLTHHKPVDPSQDSPVEGFVYSFDNGVFIPVNIIPNMTIAPKDIIGLENPVTPPSANDPPISFHVIADYIMLYMQLITDENETELARFLLIDGGVTDQYVAIAKRVIEYYKQYDTGNISVMDINYEEVSVAQQYEEIGSDGTAIERRYTINLSDGSGKEFTVYMTYGDSLAGIDVRMFMQG